MNETSALTPELLQKAIDFFAIDDGVKRKLFNSIMKLEPELQAKALSVLTIKIQEINQIKKKMSEESEKIIKNGQDQLENLEHEEAFDELEREISAL